tara:strand:+ start:11849 stop:12193 length:345 start_codon:yes stop_codon:yes gene_type:complete
MGRIVHRGVREFTGEELSGVALGQNGFKIISGAEVECGVTSGYENIAYFVALKAIDVDTEVEARSIAAGDDLTTNSGVYNGSSPVTVLQGDIIYGAFDKVEVAASDYIIAYIGR